MTIDEFNRGMQTLIEGWNGVMQSFAEGVESIRKAWEVFFSEPQFWPKGKAISPKKYGMSLRKRPYKAVLCYHYIPTTPRNLPYQRRAY